MKFGSWMAALIAVLLLPIFHANAASDPKAVAIMERAPDAMAYAGAEDIPSITIPRPATAVAAPGAVPPELVAESQALLHWLADDHFTFLGYREYVLAKVVLPGSGAEEDVLQPVAGSGLGILRERPDEADTSVAFSRLPEAVKAKAREKTLLVLAKANSRSTVHRRAYLDYVSVKTFGADGEVVGERRFLGLFSSAAYTESLTRIPVLREKAAQLVWPWVLGDYVSAGSSGWQNVARYVTEQQVGGIIISVGSPTEIAVKLNDLQRLSQVPLLVACAGRTGAAIQAEVDAVLGEQPSQLGVTPLVLAAADPAALAERIPATLPSVGRFHAAAGVDELVAVVARQLVERDYSGPVRISGSAGTGKTIVALHRATA